MKRSAWLLVLCGVTAACAKPRDAGPSSIETELVGKTTADKRPAAGHRKIPGEDITKEARAINATPPPDPSRRGSVKPSHHRPNVSKTPTGFVAQLKSRPYGSFDKLVATPAYYRGKVFAGHLDGFEMHALDASTGEPTWSARLSDHGPTAPACKDGVCVFNTHSCTMFSVDADTGRQLWSWWLGDPQLATPVIAGDTVYTSYPGRYAGLHGRRQTKYIVGAFDLKTGTKKWLTWIDARVNAAPVAHRGRIYVATLAGTLYELDARDGRVERASKGRVASAPVALTDGLYFGTDGSVPRENDMLAAAHTILPAPAEAPQEPITPKPRPVVADNRLVMLDRGMITAQRRDDGRRLWRHRLADVEPAEVLAPMLYAGGSILLATKTGGVIRMDAESGERLAAYELSSGAFAAQPIVHGGWIYAGTRDGKLVAYDTGAPELTGWEMFGGAPDRRGVIDDG